MARVHDIVRDEGLREQLVHAMRYGHILVLRMANSAADFKGTYCGADTLPLWVSRATSDAAKPSSWRWRGRMSSRARKKTEEEEEEERKEGR